MVKNPMKSKSNKKVKNRYLIIILFIFYISWQPKLRMSKLNFAEDVPGLSFTKRGKNFKKSLEAEKLKLNLYV